MATRHRKLFPNQTSTTYCQENCDSTSCTYACYPFYPDLYSASPASSTPPPPAISAVDQSNKNQQFAFYVVIMVSVLTSLFLLLSYYAIIIKYRTDRNSRRVNRQIHSDSQDFGDQNENPHDDHDHPTWLIRTVGLQQAIINSIAICKYKKNEGLVEGAECAVCLGEFQEDEILRLLPKCSHAFHISCIDTWLRSHTNCPLCRAMIVSESVNTNTFLVEQGFENSQNLSQVVDTQVEISEVGGELGENSCINEGHGLDEEDDHQSKETLLNKSVVWSSESGFLRMASNLGGDHVIVNVQHEIQQSTRDKERWQKIPLGECSRAGHCELTER
ncbi:Zinc finger, RING-type [Dillenia turbinata]|uniref:RING-type E3 ubiquitin transferase n=1 Tax=Dillenia turbinata TaxID=194707 RepID=A0AAN8VUP3_9MAGN